MKAMVCGALLVATTASAADWRRYDDPSGTVRLEVPAAWQADEPVETRFGRIVTFRIPEEGAEFTLSITPNLSLPAELPTANLGRFFPPGAELDAPRRKRGQGWNGVRQDATLASAQGSRSWLGMFYGAASTMVAITLSDETERMPARREAFDRIVQSVTFRAPAPADVRRRDIRFRFRVVPLPASLGDA